MRQLTRTLFVLLVGTLLLTGALSAGSAASAEESSLFTNLDKAMKKFKSADNPCDLGKNMAHSFAKSTALFIVTNHLDKSKGSSLVNKWLGSHNGHNFDRECFDSKFSKDFKMYYEEEKNKSKGVSTKRVHAVKSSKSIARESKAQIKQEIKKLEKKLETAPKAQKRRLKLDIITHKKAIARKEIKKLKAKIEQRTFEGKPTKSLEKKLLLQIRREIKYTKKEIKIEKKIFAKDAKLIHKLKAKLEGVVTKDQEKAIKKQLKALRHERKVMAKKITKQRAETRKLTHKAQKVRQHAGLQKRKQHPELNLPKKAHKVKSSKKIANKPKSQIKKEITKLQKKLHAAKSPVRQKRLRLDIVAHRKAIARKDIKKLREQIAHAKDQNKPVKPMQKKLVNRLLSVIRLEKKERQIERQIITADKKMINKIQRIMKKASPEKRKKLQKRLMVLKKETKSLRAKIAQQKKEDKNVRKQAKKIAQKAGIKIRLPAHLAIGKCQLSQAKTVYKVKTSSKLAQKPKSALKREIKNLKKRLAAAPKAQRRKIRLDITAHKKAITKKEINKIRRVIAQRKAAGKPVRKLQRRLYRKIQKVIKLTRQEKKIEKKIIKANRKRLALLKQQLKKTSDPRKQKKILRRINALKREKKRMAKRIKHERNDIRKLVKKARSLKRKSHITPNNNPLKVCVKKHHEKLVQVKPAKRVFSVHKVKSSKRLSRKPKAQIRQKIRKLRRKISHARPAQKRRLRLDILVHKKAILRRDMARLKAKIQRRREDKKPVDKLQKKFLKKLKRFVRITKKEKELEKKIISHDIKKAAKLKAKLHAANPKQKKAIAKRLKALRKEVNRLQRKLKKQNKQVKRAHKKIVKAKRKLQKKPSKKFESSKNIAKKSKAQIKEDLKLLQRQLKQVKKSAGGKKVMKLQKKYSVLKAKAAALKKHIETLKAENKPTAKFERKLARKQRQAKLLKKKIHNQKKLTPANTNKIILKILIHKKAIMRKDVKKLRAKIQKRKAEGKPSKKLERLLYKKLKAEIKLTKRQLNVEKRIVKADKSRLKRLEKKLEKATPKQKKAIQKRIWKLKREFRHYVKKVAAQKQSVSSMKRATRQIKKESGIAKDKQLFPDGACGCTKVVKSIPNSKTVVKKPTVQIKKEIKQLKQQLKTTKKRVTRNKIKLDIVAHKKAIVKKDIKNLKSKIALRKAEGKPYKKLVRKLLKQLSKEAKLTNKERKYERRIVRILAKKVKALKAQLGTAHGKKKAGIKCRIQAINTVKRIIKTKMAKEKKEIKRLRAEGKKIRKAAGLPGFGDGKKRRNRRFFVPRSSHQICNENKAKIYKAIQSISRRLEKCSNKKEHRRLQLDLVVHQKAFQCKEIRNIRKRIAELKKQNKPHGKFTERLVRKIQTEIALTKRQRKMEKQMVRRAQAKIAELKEKLQNAQGCMKIDVAKEISLIRKNKEIIQKKMRQQKKQLKTLKKVQKKAIRHLGPLCPSVKNLCDMKKSLLKGRLHALKSRLETATPSQKRKINLDIVAIKQAIVCGKIKILNKQIEQAKNAGKSSKKLETKLKHQLKKKIALIKKAQKAEKKIQRATSRRIAKLKRKMENAAPKELKRLKRQVKSLKRQVASIQQKIQIQSRISAKTAAKAGVSRAALVSREVSECAANSPIHVESYTAEDSAIYKFEGEEDRLKALIKKTKKEVIGNMATDKEKAIVLNDTILKPAQKKLTKLLIKKAKMEIRRDRKKLRELKKRRIATEKALEQVKCQEEKLKLSEDLLHFKEQKQTYLDLIAHNMKAIKGLDEIVKKFDQIKKQAKKEKRKAAERKKKLEAAKKAKLRKIEREFKKRKAMKRAAAKKRRDRRIQEAKKAAKKAEMKAARRAAKRQAKKAAKKAEKALKEVAKSEAALKQKLAKEKDPAKLAAMKEKLQRMEKALKKKREVAKKAEKRLEMTIKRPKAKKHRKVLKRAIESHKFHVVPSTRTLVKKDKAEIRSDIRRLREKMDRAKLRNLKREFRADIVVHKTALVTKKIHNLEKIINEFKSDKKAGFKRKLRTLRKRRSQLIQKEKSIHKKIISHSVSKLAHLEKHLLTAPVERRAAVSVHIKGYKRDKQQSERRLRVLEKEERVIAERALIRTQQRLIISKRESPEKSKDLKAAFKRKEAKLRRVVHRQVEAEKKKANVVQRKARKVQMRILKLQEKVERATDPQKKLIMEFQLRRLENKNRILQKKTQAEKKFVTKAEAVEKATIEKIHAIQNEVKACQPAKIHRYHTIPLIKDVSKKTKCDIFKRIKHLSSRIEDEKDPLYKQQLKSDKIIDKIAISNDKIYKLREQKKLAPQGSDGSSIDKMLRREFKKKSALIRKNKLILRNLIASARKRIHHHERKLMKESSEDRKISLKQIKAYRKDKEQSEKVYRSLEEEEDNTDEQKVADLRSELKSTTCPTQAAKIKEQLLTRVKHLKKLLHKQVKRLKKEARKAKKLVKRAHKQINKLQRKLEEAKNPKKRAQIKFEIRRLEKKVTRLERKVEKSKERAYRAKADEKRVARQAKQLKQEVMKSLPCEAEIKPTLIPPTVPAKIVKEKACGCCKPQLKEYKDRIQFLESLVKKYEGKQGSVARLLLV